MKNVAQVNPIRFPVELAHTPISYEGGKHVAQVVASHNDWDPLNEIAVSPHLIHADSVGIITQVHERTHNNLIVDCDLQWAQKLFRQA